MGASFRYPVLEPMPDAASALARARELLRDHGSREPDDPWVELGEVVSAE
ncbi:hypothetical protein [Streptomyces sp. RPT161]|nr:hypothetical protein [Streptomyces sp. RPT161]